MTLHSLDHALAGFWVEFLRHLWQSALVILPLFAVARALRTAPARWAHRVWLGALVKLFVPLALFGPALGIVVRGLLSRRAPSAIGGSNAYRVLTTIVSADGAARSSALGQLPAHFWIVITAAYAAIATWLLIRLWRDVIASRRLALDSAPVGDIQRERLESALQAAGIPDDRVVVVESNIVPGVVGIMRSIIVVPARLLDTLDADELKSVLLHEDAHRRSFDPAVAALQRVASSLMFFFPLLPFVQRRLTAAAEVRCDEAALRGGAQPAAYVRALARTIAAELEPAPAFASLGDGIHSLADRIERLGQPWRTTTMFRHRVALGVAVAILACGIFLPIAPSNALADGVEGGVSGGVKGGVEGGVTGGIQGGVSGGVKGGVEGGVTGGIQGGVAGGVKGGVGDDALEPTEGMVLPKLVSKIEPAYPKDALAARAVGHVVVKAVVEKDGSVTGVEVVRHVDGWPSFDKAAVDAVSKWKYTPGTKDGQVVRVILHIRVDFRMGEADDADAPQ